MITIRSLYEDKVPTIPVERTHGKVDLRKLARDVAVLDSGILVVDTLGVARVVYGFLAQTLEGDSYAITVGRVPNGEGHAVGFTRMEAALA